MLAVCPVRLVETTLSWLRAAGQKHCECVVLWLGRRNGEQISIDDAFLPRQMARSDIFRIPPTGMTELQAELRRRRCMVAAQVHSHPQKAFHSQADDQWAIVRHEGALSLVVPYFAAETTVTNFLDLAKVYRFSGSAQWLEVPKIAIPSCLRIS